MSKHREVEIKLQVSSWEGKKNFSLTEVNDKTIGFINNFITASRFPIYGHAQDTFYKSPTDGPNDFIRVRRRNTEQGDISGQLTLKAQDRGSVINRVEIDVNCQDFETARVFSKAVFGEDMGKVSKRYHVHFSDDDTTTISVYQVDGDPEKRVFIEIEAKTKTLMTSITKKYLSYMSEHGISFDWCDGSLYQVFIKKDGNTARPIDDFFGV